MPKISDRESDMQCRLCTSTEEGQIEIFGPEGECRNLASKIKECLPVSVEKEDTLTKKVCRVCAQKLDDFHNFRGACIQAEVALETLKYQQPSAFPLEPECCLQEVEHGIGSVRPLHSADSGRVTISSSVNNVYNMAHLHTNSRSLNIFPRPNSPTVKKLLERQGVGDLVITPVIPETNIKQIPQENNPKTEVTASHWPRVGHPTLEDYVLMKEDTFTIDSSCLDNHNRTPSRLIASGQIEFHSSQTATNPMEQDKDILLAQRRKREILPPMWDVYEKMVLLPGKENSDSGHQNGNSKKMYTVTHRRYIISKGAFPCSLCKRCFKINQGFDRETSESRDLCDGDDNSADVSNSKSSDCDDHTSSTNNSQINMKFFSCHICCKVFPRRSSLKRHQRTHMERKLFSCPLCQKGFNRKEHLSRHMISHSGGRPYNCDICYKPFTRKEHLSRHRLCHMNALRYSLGASSSTPEISIQNSNCKDMPPEELSANPNSTDNATGGQDDDDSSNMSRPFVCDLCGQGFARKEHLLRHQLRTHRTTPDIRDELKPYICTICSKNFTRKEHLVRHQKIHMRDFLFGSARGVIPGTDVSVSPVLTNRAISSGGTVMKTEPLEGLIPHSNLTGLSISTIPVKTEPSSSWDDVQIEPADTEGNQSLINGQDDNISVQSSLQDSVDQTAPSTSAETDTGNGDGVNKPHRCQFCLEKTFTRRSHLVRHFKRFHADKPLSLVLSSRHRASAQEKQEFERYMLNNGQYWCVICGKTFGRRYHLIRHMKLHGPNEVARPFHCSACNNSFSRHEYFQTHKCKVSSDVSLPDKEEVVPKTEEENTSGVLEEVKEVVKKLPAKRDKRKRSKCNYECVTCGKGFSKKKLLNRHSESHADLMEDNSQNFYE